MEGNAERRIEWRVANGDHCSNAYRALDQSDAAAQHTDLRGVTRIVSNCRVIGPRGSWSLYGRELAVPVSLSRGGVL